MVRTERGMEAGEVLSEAIPLALQMIAEPTKGKMIRVFTPEDEATADRLREAECREFDACRNFISQRKLQMELVDVEHLFGSEPHCLLLPGG